MALLHIKCYLIYLGHLKAMMKWLSQDYELTELSTLQFLNVYKQLLFYTQPEQQDSLTSWFSIQTLLGTHQ